MTKLLWLLAIPCVAQPSWVSIATPSGAYQYFRYWGKDGAAHERKAETFDAANPHPRMPAGPYVYHFFDPPAGKRTVCALEDRPGVYWYSPEGVHIGGTFVTANPSEFNVSALQTGIRGFAVTAAFAGAAARPGAIEVAYFTDRACSDGGVEYGFSRDLATSGILVYWATFANCGNDVAGLCRKTNHPAPGRRFSNIQQENAGADADHGFRIYGLDAASPYTYKMFVDRGSFRVGVFRDGKLTQCSETANTPLAPCSFTKTPGEWFPIGRLTAGYIVAGTQTVGDPGIAKDSGFAVSDILVAK